MPEQDTDTCIIRIPEADLERARMLAALAYTMGDRRGMNKARISGAAIIRLAIGLGLQALEEEINNLAKTRAGL